MEAMRRQTRAPCKMLHPLQNDITSISLSLLQLLWRVSENTEKVLSFFLKPAMWGMNWNHDLDLMVAFQPSWPQVPAPGGFGFKHYDQGPHQLHLIRSYQRAAHNVSIQSPCGSLFLQQARPLVQLSVPTSPPHSTILTSCLLHFISNLDLLPAPSILKFPLNGKKEFKETISLR